MIRFITIPDFADYQVTLKLMEDYVNKVISDHEPEIIYLVEHSEVYTAGTSYKQEELLNYGDIPVIYTGRGGKFTFHGPGQRVIYPILNLASPNRHKDLKLYIKMLEEWIINSLNYFGIKAYIIKDKVGIWVKVRKDEFAKIAAIGIRVRKWVTYHGVAINISTDLSKFSGIIPCGLENSLITSLNQLGIHVEVSEFDKIIQTEFNKIFK
ncbi:lipoate-protein ligase B [Rickettsia amblyommatis]|uniref:Octanoyltransferase n=2 Tax=Rickettsia amblyommatis TaxID=33989 RepID=H8K3N4_RICAG|nr:lipoyl(octanoyl) transferase LipB [Rickettsia amblyommatis]AFC69128.1 lipoate-protein ligase B [Rickettsia amblyommatis str. GAT-30V]ALA61292.1 lipoate--protein ligase [Rickettsia amblyommatis]ARD87400.1 lipoate-protein ligase B [Rickettsia amblyommatis]KJV61320.1 lipoyl(octanoyl) transferase [Rickettsia amblyommatis str. Ac/Pa]